MKHYPDDCTTVEQKIEFRRNHLIENAPVTQRAIFRRAYAGNSRTAAVKAMCLRCSNFERREVTHCTVYDCPLRDYRPYQTGDGSEDEGA